MPYFIELARHNDPGKQQLHEFMDASRQFMLDLLNNNLQLDHPKPDLPPALLGELRQQTLAVFQEYVYDKFGQLHTELERMDIKTLTAAGLTGQPQRLTLKTLADPEISAGDQAAYWPRIAKMLEQTDDILSSILDPIKSAAPGIASFVAMFKEFRTTMRNIVEG